MMYPDDTFKLRWDLLVMVLLMFTCFTTPYRLAFYIDEEDPVHWRIINQCLDFSFFIDIIANFNTAYQNNQYIVVDDRKTIAWNYISSWFFVDLGSVIPFD